MLLQKNYQAQIAQRQRQAEAATTEGAAREHIAQVGVLKKGLHLLAREIVPLTKARDDANQVSTSSMFLWLRMREEATSALRQLRVHQREGENPTPYELVTGQDHAAQALEHLVALVGAEEAQRCADDPTYRPAWLR